LHLELQVQDYGIIARGFVMPEFCVAAYFAKVLMVNAGQEAEFGQLVERK
jgi:hypothetical protein